MGDAAVAAAEAVGYVGAGTVEFLLGRRRVLLPRDEHAAPGRASGHRDWSPASTSSRLQLLVAARRAAAGRGARAAASTATRSRSASTPRTRRRASCPRPARVERLGVRGASRCGSREPGRAATRFGSTPASRRQRRQPALRPDARQGDRLGAEPEGGGGAAGGGARRSRGPRADHQPRLPCPRSAPLRVSRRRDRHRVPRAPRGPGRAPCRRRRRAAARGRRRVRGDGSAAAGGSGAVSGAGRLSQQPLGAPAGVLRGRARDGPGRLRARTRRRRRSRRREGHRLRGPWSLGRTRRLQRRRRPPPLPSPPFRWRPLREQRSRTVDPARAAALRRGLGGGRRGRIGRADAGAGDPGRTSVPGTGSRPEIGWSSSRR